MWFSCWLMVSWHHPKSYWANLNVLLCSSQYFLSSPQPNSMYSLEGKLQIPISRHIHLLKMSTSRWRTLMIINRQWIWCHLRLSTTISCVPLLRSGLMDIYIQIRIFMALAWFQDHHQTPSIYPAQSITTVTLPLSLTPHLPRVTALRHEWIWTPVSLQKIITTSIATYSIASVCHIGPICRMAWRPQSTHPMAHQTVSFHMPTTAISEGISQTQRCVTYKNVFWSTFRDNSVS